MNVEPMLLLQIAEERRRRLIQEAERERIVRAARVSSPPSGEVRPEGGVGNVVRSLLGVKQPSLP
ncbi:MAG TPA: hypothetical protein VF160_02020 [Candidatus Dormibacteraeota bacterium]